MNNKFTEFIKSYVASEEIAQWCGSLQQEHPFSFKITRKRNSKLGDYRYRKDIRGEHHQISINNDLNKHEFLFTFLHEYAHRVCMNRFGKTVKPHGEEWKTIFSIILQQALTQKFFPDTLTEAITIHAQNPKASCAADQRLHKLFSSFDTKNNDVTYLSDLKPNSLFLFNGKCFRKLEMRRTRAVCLNTHNHKKYLISGIAEVLFLEDK